MLRPAPVFLSPETLYFVPVCDDVAAALWW